MNKIVFPGNSLSVLADTFRADAKESFALILARPAQVRSGHRLLVETIAVPALEQYLVRDPSAVHVSPDFRLRLEKRARREGLSLIYCHSHPAQSGLPAFSPLDDTTELGLARYAQSRIPGVPHASLLIGADGCIARELGSSKLIEVWEVGSKIVRHFPRPSSALLEEHDRQIRAFGMEGQQAIQELLVVVVGLGGLGSVLIQQLAHLGVQNFLLIDPDVVDRANLGRLVGAGPKDIGRFKVDIGRRTILRINRAANVKISKGNILDEKIGRLATEADFVFCCTDSHGSRHFINQLSYQYFIPAIDMGVAIDVVDGQIQHVTGRVQMLSPGLGCLICQDGILSPDEIRWDLSNEKQRAADPYFSKRVNVLQPAVISLNSLAASLGGLMFQAAVAGAPLEARGHFIRGVPGVVRAVAIPSHGSCVNCSRHAYFGRGSDFALPVRQE